MKKTNFILSMLLMLLAMSLNVKAQTWDFATLDANDAELIEADQTGAWYHNTATDKNRYSYVNAIGNAALMANGQEIAYTKGLLFTFSAVESGKEGNFRAGNDAKNKRAWMAGGSIVIPNLKKGFKVTVSYMSSSKKDDGVRGISVSNLTTGEGCKFGTNNKGGDAKDAITDTGVVTADGDVTLTMTAAEGSSFGMYLYMIKVEDPTEDEEGGSDDSGSSEPSTPEVNDFSTSVNAQANQAVLTLKDGSLKYYNTSNVSGIDFSDGGKNVTVKQQAGDYTFENKVSAIAFKLADKSGEQQGTITNVDGQVKITEAKGWLESAYVKFEKFTQAKSYNVYVNNATKPIDTQLVRDYGTYGRADVLGLAAGTYSLKIVPVDANGNEMVNNANTVSGLVVKSYSRQGFAFTGYTPGAYNTDGTLKSGAKVLYITAKTAKTVSTEVITDKKGGKTKVEGFQAIIDAYQKGLDTTPIAFRFVGLVEKDDLDGISSSEEGIQVKGKGKDSEMPITIEGVGDDATVRGFGFLVRNSKGVEFRNIGIMRCMDDAISLDTDNSNIWVHHTDQFYGKHGSGDHAKGDGATDVKSDSKYVTVSYNRYWDTGKTNMFGMKSESGPNYISYDHNWFDHSDSRHPRVRTMTVHVWNNYFDNVAKYGVGATTGSSVFVENNYFLKTKKPILSSLQGTDGMGSKGTFSGENGGMIKAYGNYMDKTAAHFSYYNQKAPSAKGYDAYETAARNDQVPETEKTLVGGTTYNNFDTNASLMYTYTPDAVEDVPAVVTGFYGAGRMNHGDIQYNLPDNVGVDDTDSAVDSGLASLIDGYTSSFVGFFGDDNSSSGTGGDNTGGDNTGGDNTGGDNTGGGDQGGGDQGGTILASFDESPSNSMFTVDANSSYGDGKITYNEVYYKKGVKMDSKGKITFTPAKNYNMTIVLGTAKSGTNVKLNGTQTTVTGTENTEGKYYELQPIAITAGTEYVITKGSAEALVMLIKLVPVE